MEVCIIVAAVIVILFLLDYLRKPKLNFSMPWRLPFVGHALFLSDKPQLELTEWSKKHGPAYMIQLFSSTLVVISDTNLYADICNTGDFEARDRSFRFNMVALSEKYGTPQDIFSQDANAAHHENKSFILRVMRGIRNGPFFEQLTSHVCECFKREILDQSVNSVVDPYDMFTNVVYNFYYCAAKGVIGPLDSPGLKYVKRSTEITRVCMSKAGSSLDVFPWSRYFGNKTYKSLQEVNDNIWKAFVEMKEHITTHGKNEGICSAYLNDPDRPDVPEDVMACLLVNSCIGTSEAAVSYLYGTVLMLAAHPDVQYKMVDELASKGIDKPFLPSHEYDLPYLEAVILEALRCAGTVPAFTRRATRDSEIAGVKVPKDTNIIFNMHGANHDPKRWPDPWKFMPERFLDSDGKLLSPSHPIRKSFKPFGVTQKYCLGMPVVKDLLTMMIVFMVIEFDIQGVAGIDIPWDSRNWYRNSIGMIPARCQLRFTPKTV